MTEQISANERVAIFIDNNFLHLGLKATISGLQIDHLKLCKKMATPGKLTRVRLYTTPPPPISDDTADKQRQRADH